MEEDVKTEDNQIVESEIEEAEDQHFAAVESINPGHEKTEIEMLNWIMELRQMSQKDLAKLLKTTQGFVSGLMCGKRCVSPKVAKLLALEFGGIPSDWKNPTKPRKNKTKAGSVVTSVSIGQSNSVGDGAPENPIIIKEKLPPKDFTRSKTSEVSISYGVTKSLGNFEFIRCDVWAKDFCEAEKKQECWDRLDKEVMTRLEKTLGNIDKVKSLIPNTPIEQSQASIVGNELPEMELVDAPIVEEKKADGDASEEMRKCIHKEVLRLAKVSRIKYNMAVQKLRDTVLTHDFASDLLAQLMDNNVSFFVGENNGSTEQPEANGI